MSAASSGDDNSRSFMLLNNFLYAHVLGHLLYVVPVIGDCTDLAPPFRGNQS